MRSRLCDDVGWCWVCKLETTRYPDMHGFREESGGLNWLIYVDMEKTGMLINVILFLQIWSVGNKHFWFTRKFLALSMHLYLRFVLRHRLRCNSQVKLLQFSRDELGIGKSPTQKVYCRGNSPDSTVRMRLPLCEKPHLQIVNLCYGMVAPCLVPMMLCGGFKWFLRSSGWNQHHHRPALWVPKFL